MTEPRYPRPELEDDSVRLVYLGPFDVDMSGSRYELWFADDQPRVFTVFGKARHEYAVAACDGRPQSRVSLREAELRAKVLELWTPASEAKQ